MPNCPTRSCAATRRGGSVSTRPAGAARSARATANCASRCTSCPTCGSSATTCRGRRYNPETLAVHFHGHSIADVLDMSCGRASSCFENIPKIRRVLQTLCDVGLDYLRLGQPAPTLSGGEAQRVKLAAELARPDTGQTLYLLDEPTTGLHFEDLARLLDVLNRLVDLGNTVVVIEHNLDVIKTADWVIDMGPEAGEAGGYVVMAGTPEQLAAQCAGCGAWSRQEHWCTQRGPGHQWHPFGCSEAPAVAHRRDPRAGACRRSARRAQTVRLRSRSTPAVEQTWRSARSAARPRCPGKPTAAAGTRRSAWAATASPAAGTARFWPASSIAFRSWARSGRRIGTVARWSRSPAKKRATAGSCTP